jgi:hypothetical protein
MKRPHTQQYRVGATLPNGAILLAWKEERDSVVVLALTNQNTEYATWLMDESGGPYSGHYHSDLLYAVDEYKQRK